MASTQHGRNLTSLVYWTTIYYSAVPLTIVCTKYALTSSVLPYTKKLQNTSFRLRQSFLSMLVILRMDKTFEQGGRLTTNWYFVSHIVNERVWVWPRRFSSRFLVFPKVFSIWRSLDKEIAYPSLYELWMLVWTLPRFFVSSSSKKNCNHDVVMLLSCRLRWRVRKTQQQT